MLVSHSVCAQRTGALKTFPGLCCGASPRPANGFPVHFSNLCSGFWCDSETSYSLPGCRALERTPPAKGMVSMAPHVAAGPGTALAAVVLAVAATRTVADPTAHTGGAAGLGGAPRLAWNASVGSTKAPLVLSQRDDLLFVVGEHACARQCPHAHRVNHVRVLGRGRGGARETDRVRGILRAPRIEH